jgi:hypothetical protein
VTLSSVSDVDNQTLQSAKVSISSGFLTGDVLSANVAGTSITASYDPTTGVLTLTGNDTLVHYRQVLDSVTYNSTSNPTNFGADTSRTISWVVNDSTLNSVTQTTTLTIPAQGAAPVLGNMTATIAFTNEQWQAIEHAYGRQLNIEVRQQISQGLRFRTHRRTQGDGAGTYRAHPSGSRRSRELQASRGACARGCRRASRWGSGPSSWQRYSGAPWLTAR